MPALRGVISVILIAVSQFDFPVISPIARYRPLCTLCLVAASCPLSAMHNGENLPVCLVCGDHTCKVPGTALFMLSATENLYSSHSQNPPELCGTVKNGWSY